MDRGVIVGADERQEWLLKWWWENYTRQNNYPVCFFDFGLSQEMKKWCKTKGALLPSPKFWVHDEEEVSAPLSTEWNRRYPQAFWDSRRTWFQKPSACLSSPFKKTLWLDLDCEVIAPLDPLFSYGPFALAKDSIAPTYNSGVIVFDQGHPLLKLWAEAAPTQNGSFRGDQDLLTYLIEQHSFTVQTLPPIYNWPVGFGSNPNASIVHWLGDAAKSALKNQQILRDYHEKLPLP